MRKRRDAIKKIFKYKIDNDLFPDSPQDSQNYQCLESLFESASNWKTYENAHYDIVKSKMQEAFIQGYEAALLLTLGI